jgi:hypothetical protein
MLIGYFDESGHESREWVSVGGFIGNPGHWEAFVPAWKAALGQRKTLHMNSLRWKQERTQTLLARLGPIPHQCGLHGARGVVRVSDFIDLTESKGDDSHYTGYFACLNVIVPQLLRGTPKHERIEFVFEQQKEYAHAVEATMAFYTHRTFGPRYAFSSNGLPRIAKWSFVPKGTTVMTDPADYLAFALREMHEHPSSQKTKWCLPIFSGRRDGFGRTMTREQLRRIVLRAQAMAEAHPDFPLWPRLR